MLEKGKRSDLLWDQARCVPAIKEYLSEEDILRILGELMTTISPGELAAITDMVKNLHREAEISAPEARAPVLSLALEITGDNGAEPHSIPVTLKSLCSEMVVLNVDGLEGIADPATLQGKIVTLRLTDPASQESMKINAIMTWTQSQGAKEITVILRMLNTQPDNPASETLGDLPKAALIEAQWFRNLWKDIPLTREEVDRRDNFLLLCLACGTIGSSFFEPRTFQTMQYLLSVVGLGNVIKLLRERLR